MKNLEPTRPSSLWLSVFATAGLMVWTSLALAADRPNILFILTDDQAPWALGSAGTPEAKTPNLDRLFEGGARFHNAFCVTPVCSPSRASIMTSRYGTEVGITDWINPRTEADLGLDPSWTTWPELLQQAGYQTCLVGKWHLGTQDRFHPTVFGFDRFFGFREGGTKVVDPVLEIEGATQEFKGLTVDILTDHALEFLKQDKHGKPFLLCLHYRSPHAPWLPVADEDWAPFENLDPAIPNPDYPDLDTELVKQKMREYLASVAGVDRNVGRVLDLLKERGIEENTVVIFTSDHGYNMGHNGIWHKGNGHWITRAVRDLPHADPRKQRPNMYDNSIRVPAALRWPAQIRPDTDIHQTVSHLDWYPTILAIAGIEKPQGLLLRGRNVMPALKGAKIAWSPDLYAQYSQHSLIDAHMRMYRTPQAKLMRDTFRTGKDEFYDLEKDPAETTNLIGDSAYRDRIVELDRLLRAAEVEIDDPALKEVQGEGNE